MYGFCSGSPSKICLSAVMVADHWVLCASATEVLTTSPATAAAAIRRLLNIGHPLPLVCADPCSQLAYHGVAGVKPNKITMTVGLPVLGDVDAEFDGTPPPTAPLVGRSVECVELPPDVSARQ